MKYDKERFEWLSYDKKMGLIERELSLETHNATTRADLLMLLDWAYKKIKTDKKRIEDGIAHCYMTKFEYPGMEEGLCAGLRTMDGDGEPCLLYTSISHRIDLLQTVRLEMDL